MVIVLSGVWSAIATLSGTVFAPKPFPVGALLPFDFPHQFRPRFGSPFDTIVAVFSLYVLTFIFRLLDCPEPPKKCIQLYL